MTDIPSNRTTNATVEVGGTQTGAIETANDWDWFAVDLVAGRTYTIDLRGSRTGDGTLSDPILVGLYGSSSQYVSGTTNDNGGEGRNSHLVFTATASGRYYVAAGARNYGLGTYELEVRDTSADDTRSGAVDLGDITSLEGPRFPRNSMDGDGDRVGHYRFTLTEAKKVNLGLRQQDADADLFLEDAEGNVLHRSVADGTSNERVVATLLAGTYYARVEAQEAGTNGYVFRYGVSAPDPDVVRQLQGPGPQPPAFVEESYGFDLAENADGSVTPVALGTVSASDPEDAALTYSIVGGNESGRFAIDTSTGALSYTGPGEDHESGTASYALTVRASDGSLHDDVAVTVTVTDVDEAPGFARTGYAFELAENTDGSVTPVALGTVSASDPEGSALAYSIVGGNESGRFAIDTSTGALSYTGPGENYESDTTSYALTVRASDGSLHDDVAVTVTVTDVDEVSTSQLAPGSEPADADLPTDATTQGRLHVGGPPATGEIETRQDIDWFAVDLVAGRAYRVDVRGHDTGDGTLLDPTLYGVFDGDRNRLADTYADDGGVGINARAVFTAPADGTYFVAPAGNGYTYSGTGTYEVQVREAPFVPASRTNTFSLDENADGSSTRVALGTVSVSVLGNADLTYRIVGGDDAGRFAIDASTGALSYTGTGEDHESATTSYALTVRASDGSRYSDVAVTVHVADVDEAPEFTEPSYAFDLVENTDGSATPVALGAVAASDPEGATPTYRIVEGDGSSLFAIDASTGALSYTGTGEDRESDTNPRALTVRTSDGDLHRDVAVTVNVTDVDDEAPAFIESSYAFDLAENADGSTTPVVLGTVTASDPDSVPAYSIVGENAAGRFAIDAATGALSYAGAGEDHESDTTSYALTVRASDGSRHRDVAVTVNVVDVNEAPEFTGSSYAFDLAENANGSTVPVALGAVAASDPEGTTPTYRIVGGTAAERFAIDPVTGALAYTGTGEDHESQGAGHALTVRASDGDLHRDVAVAVTVTDVDEAPAFTATSFAFALAEKTDGRANRVALGTVTATDPEDDAVVTYGIAGGNEAGLFEIDGPTGRLFYVGAGEDRESGTASHALTVRASDGTLSGDVVVTVSVEPILSEGDTDLSDGVHTAGRTRAGESVTGTIDGADDRDWFAVELEAARAYRLDLVGTGEHGEALSDPRLFGIHDQSGELIPGTANDNGGRGRNARVVFVAPESGTYYVSAGSDEGRQGAYTLAIEDVTRVIRVSDASARERDGVLSFVVALNRTPEQTVTVRYETADGTAVAGEDYEAVSGVLEFRPLELVKRVEVRLIDDSVEDSGETLFLRLSDPTGGTLADAEGTGTIRNAETRPSVSEGDTDLPDNIETPGRVRVGESATGELAFERDDDWFAVELYAGVTYQIDMWGAVPEYSGLVSGGTLGRYHQYIRGIYDADGNLIPGTSTARGGQDGAARLYFTPSESDTFFVSASTEYYSVWDPWLSRYVWVTEEGTYTISVKELTDDYPATTHTSGLVPRNGWATGELERYGDRDWFAVQLYENRTYLIHQETLRLPDRNALLEEYIYGIYREDGSLIPGTSDDHRGSSYPHAQVRFTPDTSGLYYVSASGMGEGTYRLTVMDITRDLPASTGTTGRVSVDGSVTGVIDYLRDQDWFAVELEAGTLYRIELDPNWDPGNGRPSITGLGRPSISGIFDSNGHSVGGIFAGSNPIDGVEDDLRVTFFTPSESGTFYLAAGAFRDQTGRYVLRVKDAMAQDVHTAGTDTRGSVTVGGRVTADIDYPGDVDWYAVELEADTAYRFRLFGGGLRYPYLGGIHDSAGGLQPNTQRPTWISSYPSVDFTPDTDGTYYVAAGGGGLGGAIPLTYLYLYGGFPTSETDYAVGTYTLSVDEI